MYTAIVKPLISLILVFTAGVTFAQLGGPPEKSILRDMERSRWQKAEARLRKTLDKEPANPGVRYLFSAFYFRAENPSFNLDSAYHYAVTALDDYALSPPKERDRLMRMAVDSIQLVHLRASIDSTAFEAAREVNTERAYLEFLTHFPSSLRRDLAVELRDEVAFQDALAENTRTSFLDYLNRYPGARRASEARARYDRLLYEEETKDRQLSSYARFLGTYPETPYRDEILRHIYEISTADGSARSFRHFLIQYPGSYLVKKAQQMIFHLLAEGDNPEWPPGVLNDSLRHLLAVRHTYLVPVLKNDRYGFMDGSGREILPPTFKTIPAQYLCGYITDEFLNVDNRLINRLGTVVYPDEVEDLHDLGLGFLAITSGGQKKIVHKGGFLVHDSIDDARVISQKFMAVRKQGAWRLYTLTGRLLDDRHWDDISVLHDVVVFVRGFKQFLAPQRQVSKCAEGAPLSLSEPLDEVKAWPNDLIWGRSGAFQGVLDQSLLGVVGFDKHVLTKTFFGATAAVSNGVALYNWSGKRSSTFEQVQVFASRVAAKKSGSWFFYDPALHKVTGRHYDSIRNEGPFLLGIAGDTMEVHFPDHTMSFNQPAGVSFIPGMDSTSFLVVRYPRKNEVFDLRGRKLFSASFDALEYAGQGVFVTTANGRKGLLNMGGRQLLPHEYDAIGSAKGDVVSVLRNKKFGAYSIRRNKLIKPHFDRNLIPYSEDHIVAFKEGYYGFIGWDNRPVSAFEFEEIVCWDDAVALTRNGSIWSFYDIQSRKMTERNIRKLFMIKDADDEKIAIVQKEANYGVMSNQRGVVIPITFSTVVNVGSRDHPMYFTEKHIREASLFIVIYYDADGNLLRKEIYDDATDYEKIFCEDQ